MNSLLSSHCHTLLRLYVQVLKAVVILLALAMIVMVFGNFVLRYAFESGIAVSEEIARWALVWSGFIGATVTLIEKRHMAVTGFLESLPAPVAKALLLIAQALCLGASAFFAVGAWDQVILNMAMVGPITGWPMGLTLYGAGLFFAVHAVPIIAWQMVQLWRQSADQRPRWQLD